MDVTHIIQKNIEFDDEEERFLPLQMYVDLMNLKYYQMSSSMDGFHAIRLTYEDIVLKIEELPCN